MAKRQKKKQLSADQEFQILKLVLDKFLWVGFGVMVFGLFQLYEKGTADGFYLIGTGAVVLIIFMALLIREYEITR